MREQLQSTFSSSFHVTGDALPRKGARFFRIGARPPEIAEPDGDTLIFSYVRDVRRLGT